VTLRRLQDDNRGLALGIVVFVAMLVIAALLYIMMDGAMVEMFAFAMDDASSSGATEQIQMAQTIWSSLLYGVVFLAILFLVSRAVNEGSAR